MRKANKKKCNGNSYTMEQMRKKNPLVFSEEQIIFNTASMGQKKEKKSNLKLRGK